MLRSLEDLSHGINQINNLSMSFSEKYKDVLPNLGDFTNFLKMTYQNHYVLRRKICKSVCSISICERNLKKNNKKYLKYKLINLSFTDVLQIFLDNCQKFVNQMNMH